MTRRRKPLPPIHPGEILRDEYLQPLGLCVDRLALDLRVPVTRVSAIVRERRGITTDTALRLARYFNASARYWMNLQSAYDLELAEDELAAQIEQEVRRVDHHEAVSVKQFPKCIFVPKVFHRFSFVIHRRTD
jgi:antitoxin HigA-1